MIKSMFFMIASVTLACFLALASPACSNPVSSDTKPEIRQLLAANKAKSMSLKMNKDGQIMIEPSASGPTLPLESTGSAKSQSKSISKKKKGEKKIDNGFTTMKTDGKYPEIHDVYQAHVEEFKIKERPSIHDINFKHNNVLETEKVPTPNEINEKHMKYMEKEGIDFPTYKEKDE